MVVSPPFFAATASPPHSPYLPGLHWLYSSPVLLVDIDPLIDGDTGQSPGTSGFSVWVDGTPKSASIGQWNDARSYGLLVGGVLSKPTTVEVAYDGSQSSFRFAAGHQIPAWVRSAATESPPGPMPLWVGPFVVPPD